jgi:hypothetical protein
LFAAGSTGNDPPVVNPRSQNREVAPAARNPALGLIQGSPLGAEITARDPAGLDRAVEAATEAITERFGPGPSETSMQAHVFTATRLLS